MSEPAACHCITCSDEGTPMRVLRIADSLAACRDPDGVLQEVEIDLVAPVALGETVLVHAGVAIANLGRDPVTAPAGAPR